MANRIAVVAVSIVALGWVSGCQSTQERMEAHMMDVSEQQMAFLQQASAQCAGYGCVWLQSEPAGAQLLVDGAEILQGDAESLILPLGAHEFTATWPDGQKAVRKVYVPQMKLKYDINYSVNSQSGSGGGRGSITYSGKPEVEKTVIVLAKPK